MVQKHTRCRPNLSAGLAARRAVARVRGSGRSSHSIRRRGASWGVLATSAGVIALALVQSSAAMAQLVNRVTIDPPSSAAGSYLATGAAFGPAPTAMGAAGSVVLVSDGSGNPTEGCSALIGFPAGAIALIDRGNCAFDVKVANAQAAGAVGVIIVNNVAGDPITLGGSDPTIMIPAVMISLANGNAIKAGLPATGLISGLRSDLTLTKSAETSGGNVLFTITVMNQGPDDATGVVVIDDLPAEVNYVSDTCGGSNVPPWTWNIGSLANGASDTCSILTTVVSPNPGSVSNSASVSGDQGDPDSESASDSVEVDVAVAPAPAPATSRAGLLVLGVLLAFIAAYRFRQNAFPAGSPL